MNDRKKDIGFDKLPILKEEDYASIQYTTRGARKGTLTYNKKIERHVAAWERYQNVLSQIKVLDPACGSGAFLNEVFDFLYREGQTVNSELTTLNAGQAKLFRWDTHILANNIYGVDINPESVEITKLSLWLKTANRGEKLTYLDGNIRCGNSLIDDHAVAGGHSFNWAKEFPKIMKAGGFDVVLGNPPWGASFDTAEREYFKEAYADVHMRSPESFNYFVGRGNHLSRGYGGFIIPSSYLNQHEFTQSRQHILSENSLLRVINLGDGVFDDVSTPTCIVIWKKKADDNAVGYYGDYRTVSRAALSARLFEQDGLLQLSRSSFAVNSSRGIIDKCSSNKSLKEVVATIATGISSGLDKAFIYDSEAIAAMRLERGILQKLVIGGEITRYCMSPKSGKYIAYLTGETDLDRYPNIKKAILPYKAALAKRREAANGKMPWFSLHWPRRKNVFENPKIIIRQTASSIMASFDEDGWYCLKSAITIQLPAKTRLSYLYFLALLNSKLMDYLYQDLVGEKARIFPEVKPLQLFKLPIKEIGMEQQRPFIEKVKTIIENRKALQELSSKFLALLKSEFRLETPGEKLHEWFMLDFPAFAAELAKKKVYPTLVQKAEWMDHFEKQKVVAAELKANID